MPGEEQANVGVGDDDEARRSTRARQEPERFVAGPAARNSNSTVFTQMRVVFLQAVNQYQKIEASMPRKQYGMATGLKIFGEVGYDGVASEIRDNLHGRGVIDPVHRNKVTHDIRKASLPYLMFLKRKRCDKIK